MSSQSISWSWIHPSILFWFPDFLQFNTFVSFVSYICPYHLRRTSCVTVDRGLHILPTTFFPPNLQADCICNGIVHNPRCFTAGLRCQWCFSAPWALGLFPGHTSCDRLVASSDCRSLSFFWAVSEALTTNSSFGVFFSPRNLVWMGGQKTSNESLLAGFQSSALRFGCITTPTSMIKSCMLRPSYRSYPSFVPKGYRSIVGDCCIFWGPSVPSWITPSE